MADDKVKDKGIKGGGVEAQDAMDIMGANIYGISPEFMRKYGKILDDTRKVLTDKLSINRISDIEGTTEAGKGSQVIEFVKALTSGIRDEEKLELLRGVKKSSKYTQPSGSHTISDTDDTIDKLSDGAAVDELLAEVQNHFSLMPEYSKIVDIIPELSKAVEMIVKDIINRDEFTQKYVTNFYKDEEDHTTRANVEDKIKELLEEYDFESKIRRWLLTAEVVGVKPFSILPQDDVVFMINKEIANRKNNGYSTENLIPTDIYDLISEESFLQKSPLKHIYDSYEGLSLKTISIEGDELLNIKKAHTIALNPFVDSVITPDIIDEWEEVCLEELQNSYYDNKIENIRDPKAIEKTTIAMESFLEEVRKPGSRVERSTRIKDQLNDLIVAFDRSIEVVDPMKGPVYQATRQLNNNLYSNGSIDKSVVDNFYRIDDGNDVTPKDKVSKTINLNGFEIDINNAPIDGKEYAKAVRNRRAILTDYEPEHVVPISAGGTHIGYYVVEYIRTSGDNFMMLKKDRGSFLDIVRRIGVGEDSALTKNSGTTAVDSNNPFSSGVFSPSTIMAPVMSGGPNMPFGKFGQGGSSSRKVELIKSILIKTITKRLGDEKLIENGTFQSSLMNLIRDDILFRNNVRFTFIPESHMVYMSRELDSDGYPLSIFNGTLFACYTYISSLISSLMMKVMKSSDVETMEVNIGKSKELGLTIGSISKNASTRNVSAKTLFGGTESIVRSVGNFKRIIIPVVDGEKLFDVTQVERANNVDIDDDFTDKMLKSVVMKIGVPPTSLDMLSQDEYVASQTQHRVDYRNLIVDRGVNYSKHVTKAIKLLVHYSDISIPTLGVNGSDGAKDNIDDDKKKKTDIKIDITKIDFKFTPPKTLTVSKVSEELESISTLVDSIIKMYYGDDSRSGEEWPVLMLTTRKYLMKHLSSSTDWQNIDEVIDEAKRNAPKTFAELQKYDIAVIPTPNADTDAGGGGYDGGDDSGGGGDDFGGGGDEGGFGGDEGGGEEDFSATGDEGGSEDKSSTGDGGTEDKGSSDDEGSGF